MEVVKYNGEFTVRQHGRQQWDDDEEDDEVKRRVGLERSSALKFNGEKRHPWLAGWSSLVDRGRRQPCISSLELELAWQPGQTRSGTRSSPGTF